MKAGKYQPLFKYLRRSKQDEITLTFAEIEMLMNDHLPNSARTQRAWWSNRKSKGSLQATAWMEAKYHVAKVDFEQGQVTFQKIAPPKYEIKRVGDAIVWDAQAIKFLRFQLGLNQSQLAEKLGVRQQTISEWENGLYAPNRAMSKYLTMVAEQAGFRYVDISV